MKLPEVISIASDHAGFELKEFIKEKARSVDWQDYGPKNSDRVDYPDYAEKLCRDLSKGNFGILICGSGQGMAMAANRFQNIRAALCWNPDIASLARKHNDANVLCLGARHTNPEQALDILESFFLADFEGGRHQQRVDKLQNLKE